MTTGDHEAATRAFADLRIAGYDRAVEIGRGGFAVVYRARRIAFAQDVAIKVLTRSIDENAAARFDRERQVLGALAQHPHIVTVYDSGTTPDGLPFLVMEFLPGGPLSAQLEQHGWSRATASRCSPTSASPGCAAGCRPSRAWSPRR
jgi:serine/threonine protein kinase